MDDLPEKCADGSRRLSDNEEKFCELMVSSRYGAFSYRQAFEPWSKTTTTHHHNAAQKLLRDNPVVARIDELRKFALDQMATTLQDCLQNWTTLAFADPDELIGLRVGACRHCWGEGNQYQWRELEFMEAIEAADYALRIATSPAAKALIRYPDVKGGFGYDHTAAPADDCPMCAGEGLQRVVARDTSRLSPAARLLYGGVKQTRNGIEVIMADRVKALENVTRMLGGFKDGIDLNTNGPLVAMTQAVLIQSTDPMEAGRLYEKMIRRET